MLRGRPVLASLCVPTSHRGVAHINPERVLAVARETRLKRAPLEVNKMLYELRKTAVSTREVIGVLRAALSVQPVAGKAHLGALASLLSQQVSHPGGLDDSDLLASLDVVSQSDAVSSTTRNALLNELVGRGAAAFSAEQLVDTCYSLAKWNERGQVSSNNMVAYKAFVVDCLKRLRDVDEKSLSPGQARQLAYAFGSQSAVLSASLLLRLSPVLLKSLGDFSSSERGEIAGVYYGVRVDDLKGALASLALESESIGEISSVLSSLSFPKMLLGGTCDALCAKVTCAEAELSHLSTKESIRLLNALARFRWPAPELFATLGGRLNGRRMSNEDIANAVDAFQMGQHHHMEVLNPLLWHMEGRADVPLALQARVLLGCSVLNLRAPRFVRQLSHCVETSPTLQDMDTTDLANAVLGIALQGDPEGLALLRLEEEIFLRGVETFSSTDVVRTAFGFVVSRFLPEHGSQRRPLLSALLKRIEKFSASDVSEPIDPEPSLRWMLAVVEFSRVAECHSMRPPVPSELRVPIRRQHPLSTDIKDVLQQLEVEFAPVEDEGVKQCTADIGIVVNSKKTYRVWKTAIEIEDSAAYFWNDRFTMRSDHGVWHRVMESLSWRVAVVRSHEWREAKREGLEEEYLRTLLDSNPMIDDM